MIYFCKNSAVYAPSIATQLPSAAISIDWTAELAKVREQVGPTRCLQGNLDPLILDAPIPVVIKETKRMLAAMDKDPAYIFNLGHGILPLTPVESVAAVVKTVKEWA